MSGCRGAWYRNPKNQAKCWTRPRGLTLWNGITCDLTCAGNLKYCQHMSNLTRYATACSFKTAWFTEHAVGHKICKFRGNKHTKETGMFTASSDWLHNRSPALRTKSQDLRIEKPQAARGRMHTFPTMRLPLFGDVARRGLVSNYQCPSRNIRGVKASATPGVQSFNLAFPFLVTAQPSVTLHIRYSNLK